MSSPEAQGVVLVLPNLEGAYSAYFARVRPEDCTARRVRVRFGDVNLGTRWWTFTTQGFVASPIDAEWFGIHRLLTRDCYDALQHLVELIEFVKDGKEPWREAPGVTEPQCNRFYDFPEKSSS